MAVHPARRLWHAVEVLHAVTYFAPACREGHAAAGLRGFWMGYFGCRAAPLGPVGPDVVVALFAGFERTMVARALPDAWGFAGPAACIRARSASAAAALREAGVDEAALAAAAERLTPVVAGLDVTGRPLGAANAALAATPDPDPVAACWQVATALREHRGDGHVAALVVAGLSGLDAHVLQSAAGGAPPHDLRAARGWSEDQWDAAAARLAPVDGAAALADVEASTDERAWSGGLDALGTGGVGEVVDLLRPSVDAVLATGWLRFPNPMGLPEPTGL